MMVRQRLFVCHPVAFALVVLWVVALVVQEATVHAFSPIKLQHGWSLRSNVFRASSSLRSSSSSDGNWFEEEDSFGERRSMDDDIMEQQDSRDDALVEALVCPTRHDSLLDMYLVGRGSVGVSNQKGNSLSCLVLSPNKPDKKKSKKAKKLGLFERVASKVPRSSLWVPLSTTSATLVSSPQLKLLSFAYANKPLSKSVCLVLNSILVNRDGGLFDNLPWSTWSVDPQLRNRDAAGNPVLAKFHLGKRDAYNRFMGRDWQGRSVSIGNLALRLKYTIEEILQDDEELQEDELFRDAWREDSTDVLARRILELQIREIQMELAEWDYQLAIARTNEPYKVPEIERARKAFEDRLNDAQESLDFMLEQQKIKSGVKEEDEEDPFYIKILDKVANMTTDFGKNAAPYRGAMGYAPVLDSKEDIEEGRLPYSSPYDLMKEIIGEQLNADVIGAVLENTSLLKGTVALGGALVLRRRTPKKTTTIMGEEVSVSDRDEDFGNVDGTGGSTILVECEADEAVGMALAYDIPIRVESQIWDRSSLLASQVVAEEENKDVREVIPLWETRDGDIEFLVEGKNKSDTSDNISPLSVPRTTTKLYDALFEPRDESSAKSTEMFPTDNPIQSLFEYDALDNSDKAKTLLSLSNFDGRRLPRPRVVREAQALRKQNPLDDLLLPLVDESVRRQYLIRDAEQRGDKETAKALREKMSPRQVAKEKAEQAREVGEDDVADWWDNEADLYESLRADVTQDEGSYSRFLDKDEWYERDRRARAKKVKKGNFGNLLDGLA